MTRAPPPGPPQRGEPPPQRPSSVHPWSSVCSSSSSSELSSQRPLPFPSQPRSSAPTKKEKQGFYFRPAGPTRTPPSSLCSPFPPSVCSGLPPPQLCLQPSYLSPLMLNFSLPPSFLPSRRFPPHLCTDLNFSCQQFPPSQDRHACSRNHPRKARAPTIHTYGVCERRSRVFVSCISKKAEQSGVMRRTFSQRSEARPPSA